MYLALIRAKSFETPALLSKNWLNTKGALDSLAVVLGVAQLQAQIVK